MITDPFVIWTLLIGFFVWMIYTEALPGTFRGPLNDFREWLMETGMMLIVVPYIIFRGIFWLEDKE